jgi:predicted MFS family arabinose efflux permease
MSCGNTAAEPGNIVPRMSGSPTHYGSGTNMNSTCTVTMPLERFWKQVGWVTIFLVGTDLFVVSPFLPVIGRDLHQEAATMTWTVSVFSITYAIACPLLGRLAERVGLGRMLLVGTSTLALANLLTACSVNFAMLLASRVLAGLAAASISPMLYALAADRSEPTQRASNLALINSGLVIALMMGAPLGLLMGSYSGWRQVFILLSVCFVVMLLVNRKTWPRPKGVHVPRPQVTPIEHLRNAALHMTCMVFWSASIYANYTLLATALEAEYHYSTYAITATLICFGLGAFIGSVRGGRIADRIGAGRMVRWCFVLMACIQAITWAVYPLQWHGIYTFLLFALALSSYGFFPALQACVAQKFTARRPTVLGLLSSSLYVGMTLGAALGGLMYAESGMQGVIALSIALGLVGTAFSSRL